MPFDDDPSISGDENLLRRIAASWIHWDENGNPNISSAAFKDEYLSVCLARDGRPPADAIRNYAGYGLAAITAAHARALNQRVARDPLPEEPAHTIVYGRKKRGGIAGALRDGASWIVFSSAGRTRTIGGGGFWRTSLESSWIPGPTQGTSFASCATLVHH